MGAIQPAPYGLDAVLGLGLSSPHLLSRSGFGAGGERTGNVTRAVSDTQEPNTCYCTNICHPVLPNTVAHLKYPLVSAFVYFSKKDEALASSQQCWVLCLSLPMQQGNYKSS